ncbi:hypothetical protein Lche_3156 [Legionella cherrii]|uniref:FAD-binding domain-containing protein n=2 Tax=Legionella cherrii TaxID=28084 RepID=A0A0W0SCM0_9GAMM|nr:hypothetical protein [Legionella cherrii]KTC81136.1 hypothetical protein Lche_3156 [Legionella cherrii]
MHIKKDIVTIGAGPTGLSLAASLAHTSLLIVLIDKLPNWIAVYLLTIRLWPSCSVSVA